MKSVVDGFSLDLGGPIYDGVHGTLFIEVRDFGKPERTLVLRTIIDGHPVTTMVSWETFTYQLDAMRGRMMGSDWDEALSHLVGRSG